MNELFTSMQLTAIRIASELITIAYKLNNCPSPLDGSPCCQTFRAAAATLKAVGFDGEAIVDKAVENGEHEESDLQKYALDLHTCWGIRDRLGFCFAGPFDTRCEASWNMKGYAGDGINGLVLYRTLRLQ